MKTTITVLSHNDLDGVAPGILAQLAFGKQVKTTHCANNQIDEVVQAFLQKPENAHHALFITDISVNEENAIALQTRFEEGKKIQLLDHHVSAETLNRYAWANVQTVDEGGVKTCATSLFYRYLVEHGWLEETNALTEFVELVRSYDTWDWTRTENVKAKQLNDLFYLMNPETFKQTMCERLHAQTDAFSFNETEQTILAMEEEKIQYYMKRKQKQVVEITVDTYTVGVVHAENYHSELGNKLGDVFPHLDLIAMVNVGAKKISFRTIHDHVDVASFAQRYGGGGHVKASGAPLTKEAMEHFVIQPFYEGKNNIVQQEGVEK